MMIKIRSVACCIITMLSFHALAMEREIVVLSSLATPQRLPIWQLGNYNVNKDIQDRFLKAFENSGYRLVFVENADAEDLSVYLQSPKTLALFWVSHSSGVKGINSEISVDSSIADINGNNIKNIFQSIHPNIQFVSVIGCEAKEILDSFRKEGFFKKNLVVHAFDKKVSVPQGISDAVLMSAQVLDKKPSEFMQGFQCDRDTESLFQCRRTSIVGKEELFEGQDENSLDLYKEGDSISIVNSNPTQSAILMVGEIYIGLLRRGSGPQYFKIPQKAVGSISKMVVTYDRTVLKEKDVMDPLVIEGLEEKFEVTYLHDEQGRPYSRNTNIYYLKKK